MCRAWPTRRQSLVRIPHLDTGIADEADLLAVELLPLLVVKALRDGDDELRPHNIDERVPDIALVLEIDGQVEEVEHAREALVDRGQQHLLVVLVRDVLDHQGRAWILA